MLDEYRRNIDYAKISLTDECNLKCVYCTSQEKMYEDNLINDRLSFYDYKFIINNLVQIGIKKIKFIGGEPLLYPNIVELIKYAHEECGVDDISIDTNGIKLSELVYDLRRVGLKSVSINLDSLKSYKYKGVTGGGNLTEVLKSMNRCLDLGINVSVNCVVIRNFNEDEIYDFIDMTQYYPIDVRFIELDEDVENKEFYMNGYFDVNNFIDKVEGLYKINNEIESDTNIYKAKYSKGRILTINTNKHIRCEKCNSIEIKLDGKIKLCSIAKEEIDIKYYINKPMIFKEVLKEAILKKPKY